MKRKFALVLSGGGFKGAFQIGALRYLKRQWRDINPDGATMKFDIVAGVSVGSLNGVLTASDEFDALEELWQRIGSNVENIYTSDFIDTKNQSDQLKVDFDVDRITKRFIPNFRLKIGLGKMLGLVFSKSRQNKLFRNVLNDVVAEFALNFKKFRAIADNTPLRDRINELVSLQKIQNCIYKCGFVSLDDGKYYSYRHDQFTNDNDFRNAILASTAMPIVWEPVPEITAMPNDSVKVRQSVDGGIRNVSPLADVIEEINNDPEGDYTIVVINCSSGEVDEEQHEDANIAGIALRALNDIAITEIFNNDISEFLRINDIIEQVRGLHPDVEIKNYKIKTGRTNTILRPFKAIVIQTDPGVLGDSLVANVSLNARRIQHGEEKAAEALDLLRTTATDFVVV